MAKDYFIDEESGVLKNRLGISDKKTLDAFERRVSQDRATQSIDKFDLSFDGYKSVHKHLFGDLYEWAGKTRGEEIVLDGQKHYPNLDQILTKGETQFAPTNYIESEGQKYFKDFKQDLDNEAAKGKLNAELYADKLAAHIGDVNFIHPFREGNGRTMRFYMDAVSKEYGFSLTAMGFDKDRWMEASHKAMNDSHLPLKEMIIENLVMNKAQEQQEGQTMLTQEKQDFEQTKSEEALANAQEVQQRDLDYHRQEPDWDKHYAAQEDFEKREAEFQQQEENVLNVSVEKAGNQLAAKAGMKYVPFALTEERQAEYFGFVTLQEGKFVAVSQGSDLTLAPVKEIPDFERGLITMTPDTKNRTYDMRQTQEQVRQQQKETQQKQEQEIER